MAGIVLERLAKRFGPVVAVDAVDLEIASGAFFALLGPSGCGKTTLLRLIAGLEAPDSGRLRIGDLDATRLPPWSRPVNTVFQSYALFPHMSVAANVGYGLVRAGMPKAEIATRVREMLALVQLTGLDERRPHQLSGGQRQRVALARALAKLPQILLLDEPMAALDRSLREETRQQLLRIQRRLGITFVLVTHDQEEALALADRLAVMRAGRFAQIGSPRAVYDAPVDRDVAAFLGRAALIDGDVLEVADGIATLDAGALGRLQGRACAGVGRGTRATLVLRPDQLRLEPPGIAGGLQARAAHASFMGESVSLTATIADGRDVVVSLPPSAVCPPPDSAVTLAWAARDVATVPA
jgi:putrescine transport system ATP-binding protein